MTVLLAASFSSPAAANSVPACRPPGPSVGPRQTQIAKDGAISVSEYGDGGSYRETRCDRHSRVVSSVQSVPFPSAHGMVKYRPVAITTRTPGKPDALTTKFIEYRAPRSPGEQRVFDQRATKPLGRIPALADQLKLKTPTAAQLQSSVRDEQASAARRVRRDSVGRPSGGPSGNTCTDGTYGIYVPQIFPDRVATYYTNEASFPGGARTTRAIRNAAYAWNNTVNNCGLSDESNVTGARVGNTLQHVSPLDDGVSVVDFGDLSEVGCDSATVLACTFVFYSRGFRTSFDMRFNYNIGWVNGPKVGFDVQSVATHEMGHALVGLNDVRGVEHANLTMYASGFPADIRGRDLALGDILGMRAQYPASVTLGAR